jgi:hypothetical protein
LLIYRFAAAENNLSVVMYLLKQTHDAYTLLDDRKVKIKLDSTLAESQVDKQRICDGIKAISFYLQ